VLTIGVHGPEKVVIIFYGVFSDAPESVN